MTHTCTNSYRGDTAESILSTLIAQCSLFCPALDEEFREPPYPIRLAQDEEGAGSGAPAAALIPRGASPPAPAGSHARAGDRRRRSELGGRWPLLQQLRRLIGLLPGSVGVLRGRQPGTKAKRRQRR